MGRLKRGKVCGPGIGTCPEKSTPTFSSTFLKTGVLSVPFSPHACLTLLTASVPSFNPQNCCMSTYLLVLQLVQASFLTDSAARGPPAPRAVQSPPSRSCRPPAPIRVPPCPISSPALIRIRSAIPPSSDPRATHPVRGSPAQIRLPFIQPGPFSRREPQTVLFG